MPRWLGSKELVSPLMDEGPPVTGKTDGEEDPGVSSAFHSSSSRHPLHPPKGPARPGYPPGAGRSWGLKPGGWEA